MKQTKKKALGSAGAIASGPALIMIGINLLQEDTSNIAGYFIAALGLIILLLREWKKEE